VQHPRKVHKDRARVALIFERRLAIQNFVDLQRLKQVELDARAVVEHPKTNSILAADCLLLRIDADVQVVIKQLVVGAIGPIASAQHLRARGRRRGRGKACVTRLCRWLLRGGMCGNGCGGRLCLRTCCLLCSLGREQRHSSQAKNHHPAPKGSKGKKIAWQYPNRSTCTPYMLAHIPPGPHLLTFPGTMR